MLIVIGISWNLIVIRVEEVKTKNNAPFVVTGPTLPFVAVQSQEDIFSDTIVSHDTMVHLEKVYNCHRRLTV